MSASDQVWLNFLQRQRAIAVIRAPEQLLAYQMAKAVASGGMRLIEIAWNSQQAAALIQQLRSELPMCKIGAGTLLNQEQMQQAIAAGAQFLFTPHVDRTLIEMAIASSIPVIPGGLSPTEIVSAWRLGATCIKVFPIQSVGGANYIQSLQGPLGHIFLIPTGGVTLDNAKEFLAAGAIAVGLSGSLFPKQAVAKGDWNSIARRAETLLKRLQV